jgi:DNA-binding MarR family transcriptional regulator
VERRDRDTSTNERASAVSCDRSAAPPLFGDLLALARVHWIREMAASVAACGYLDYRSTDAVLVRLLRRHTSVAISDLGSWLGISRQAARKLVTGLERRGYATEVRDTHDSRVVKVQLTSDGEAYADVVIEVVHNLNRQLVERVGADDLAVASAVLRMILRGAGARS